MRFDEFLDRILAAVAESKDGWAVTADNAYNIPIWSNGRVWARRPPHKLEKLAEVAG